MHTYYEIEQLEVLARYDSHLIVGDYRVTELEFISLLFPGIERSKLLERAGMTEKEELFAKFFSTAYNKGRDVDSMSFPELDAWIRELERITFEAKASLQGATQAKREREANLKQSERDKIRNSDSTFDSTNAINAVNKRKDRMSKVDKLEATYRSLGMDEATIKDLLSKVKVDEEKQAVTTKLHLIPAAEKPKPATLIDKIVDSILEAKDKPEPKPFDATSLFPKKVNE